MQVVSKSRDAETGNDMLWFKCPGCEQVRPFAHYHRIPVSIGTRKHPGTLHPDKTWEWNGSTEKPTVKPSINITDQCHYTITDGKITYYPDSKHPLAGKTIPMPEFTEW